MTKSKLAKLETVAERIRHSQVGGRCCPHCGGRPGGTGEVALFVFADERQNLAPYGPDGRCPRCGAWSPEPKVLPALPAGMRFDVEGDPLKTKVMKAMLLVEFNQDPPRTRAPDDVRVRWWEAMAARWIVTEAVAAAATNNPVL